MAVSRSITFLIAYKAIGANSVEFPLTIFDAKEVLTHWIKESSSFKLIFFETLSITSKALFKATANPSEILDGWIPLCNKFSTASSKAPARITTLVVPSPTSIS